MTFATSPSTARLWRAIRFALLLLVCLLVAHEAVFVAQFGPGASFAVAMSERGHDGYWAEFTLFAGLAGALLACLAAARLAALSWRRHALGARELPDEPGIGSYLHELGGLWPRLVVALVLAFTVQENVEHLATHDHLIGVAALTGPEYPLALPVLTLVALGAAALGALVRWRVAVLEARIAAAARSRLPRPLSGDPRPAGWWVAAAVCAHRWILARRDAGRAPPLLLRV